MYPCSVRRPAGPYDGLGVQVGAKYDHVYEFAHELRNCSRTKNEIKETVHRMGAACVPGGSKRVEEKATPDPHRGCILA